MIREMLNLALARQPADKWPTYDGKELDRTEFLTSSEVGTCLRKSFFGKNRDKFPPKLGYGTNGYALRGHAIEAWFASQLKILEADGYKFEYMVPEQRSFYDPDIGLSGTPDGIMTMPDGKKFLLEIKSIDPRFNKNNLPKRPHVIQTQQNMFLVTKCLSIELEGAILFYIDASNVLDINEQPLSYDENAITICEQRAQALWSATDPEDLEPEGLFTGDCDHCPFTHHCSATISMQKALERAGQSAAPFLEEDKGDTEGLTIDEVFWVEQYLEAKKGIAQYTSEQEEVAPAVQELVLRHNGRIVVNGVRLKAFQMAGRETVERKALEAAGIDTAPFIKVGSPYIRVDTKRIVTGNGDD